MFPPPHYTDDDLERMDELGLSPEYIEFVRWSIEQEENEQQTKED